MERQLGRERRAAVVIKLAIIVNEQKLSGKLTRIFTGCYAYHALWVDEEAGKMYDMHLIRRRRQWPHYEAPAKVHLFQVPGGAKVTREYLEERLEVDSEVYGVRDYVRFGLRPFYHLVGATPPNASGIICSEMINDDIWRCGGVTPWKPEQAPPSPCDLLRWLVNQ